VGQVLGTFVAPAMESHELKQPFIPVIATGPFYVRFPKTTNLSLRCTEHLCALMN